MKAIRLTIDDDCASLGLDRPDFAFSWQLESSERGARQTSYRILLASDQETLAREEGDIWDSCRVESNRNTYISYEGPPLRSASTYYWSVRVWDASGAPSNWSDPVRIGTGLFHPGDWKAHWIGMGPESEPRFLLGGNASRWEEQAGRVEVDSRSVLLRKAFTIERPIVSARLFVTGLGFYQLRLNGNRIDGCAHTPSKTHYRRRTLYDAFDVAGQLVAGGNAIALHLGNGWFNPARKFWGWQMQWYGAKRAIAQLHLTYEDGATDIVITDDTWRATPGPVVSSCLYDGETYDARLEQPNCDRAGYDDSAWQPVNIVESPLENSTDRRALIAAAGDPGVPLHTETWPNPPRMEYHAQEPITLQEEIRPVSVTQPKPGVWIFDMGQNFAGWCRLNNVTGPAGAQIKLRHAENILKNGLLCDRTNHDAAQCDTYILRGDPEGETWEPNFTDHGFQYVELTQWPEDAPAPTLDTLTGCVIHSNCEHTGSFDSSNPVINRIHHCTLWSQKSNMMGLPTDDCQRAERLGWLGDGHVAFEQAAYNFDTPRLYRKWLRDIADQQGADGQLPHVAPRPSTAGSPAWSSAYHLVAWYCYQRYGDARFLSDHYDGMKMYVDWLGTQATDYIGPPDRYGDHCCCLPGWTRGNPEMTGPWYYLYVTRITAWAAAVLGRDNDVKQYTLLSDRITDALNDKFLDNENAYYGADRCQTLMGLLLEMPPAELHSRMIDNLLVDIDYGYDYRNGLGILGTKYTFDVLDKENLNEHAYLMATCEDYPSFGYMTLGRTTLSENWDRGGTNNHVMLGSIDAWFYRVLAGIRIDESKNGVESLVLAPYMPRDMDYASATSRTVHGVVSSAWRRQAEGSITWSVLIPAGVEARLKLTLPTASATVSEGGSIIGNGSCLSVPGIREVSREGCELILLAGSGNYEFEITRSV